MVARARGMLVMMGTRRYAGRLGVCRERNMIRRVGDVAGNVDGQQRIEGHGQHAEPGADPSPAQPSHVFLAFAGETAEEQEKS